MDSEILGKKEKDEEGQKTRRRSKAGDCTQYRVVISEEANLELEKHLKKASEGKEPVNITKSDLANYIFCNLSRFLSEFDIKTIRSLHFDERRVLQNLLHLSSYGEELPSELKRAIREHYGVVEKEKRRPLKATVILPADTNDLAS